LDLLAPKLPEREWDFEEDTITDRPENFVLSELIREQFFRLFGQEIPYGTGVVIDSLEKNKEKIVVKASLIVSRKAHKAIVIGRRGIKIKEIGQLARESLERYFGKDVYLELFVKHRENWINKDELILEFQDIHED